MIKIVPDQSIDFEVLKDSLGENISNFTLAKFINDGEPIYVVHDNKTIGKLQLVIDRDDEELMDDIWF